MHTELNNFTVILIYGSLVLLSFFKLTNPLNVNKKPNLWFGIFLFLWSTFWLDEILSLITHSEIQIHTLFFVNFIQFFTPIVFYFSVLFYTNPSFKFKNTDCKYLILPFIFFVNLLFLRLEIYKSDREVLEVLNYIFISLILFQALFYTSLSYFTIRKHQKKIQNFSSNTEEINLNWLEYIILIIFMVSLVFVVYNLFYNSTSLNIFINLIFLAVIYFIAYYSLKQKEIYPLEEKQREELISIPDIETEELKRKLIPDEELMRIKNLLDHLMITQQPYLDSELNLIKLSELVSVSTHHLSYVINAGFQKNFFQYVNEYRIEYAKKLLKDHSSKLSILGIAYESGFNSKTSFNTTFKKITGITPSEFKKTSSDL
ncbi:helix-turn-helix domain-containing protein [Chryseobacterium sp. 3008163]|uniref:helix-turn-helix domain-containing protein n=1 Tax=Chryseobacterium sp. 3008163 TaxID=2478663 RepID=UPI000F0C13A3|nr:helix-turn-helix domain-containing protein [Chryseobacterium sp. 3008163]AYN02126.1 AraC family transcriptional regulator [Chryseobacterium sp. 3008163]